MVDVGDHVVTLGDALTVQLLERVDEGRNVFDLGAVDFDFHERRRGHIESHRHLGHDAQIALQEKAVDLRAEAIGASMCAGGIRHRPLACPEDLSRGQKNLQTANEMLAVTRDGVAMTAVQSLETRQ